MKWLRVDWWLIIPVILLCLVSLVLLFTTTPEQGQMQLFFLLAFIGVFLVTLRVGYAIFASMHWLMYALSLVFLLLPMFIGLVSRGATRWIQIGNNSIQPSEIIKPFLLITFAAIAVSELRFRLPVLVASFLLPVGLILLQPDLGTALVITCGWAVICFGRFRMKHLFVLAVLGLVLSLPAYFFLLRPYQRERIHTFVDPYADPLGRGYHVIQSIIAVGSGQVVGRGLGRGTQSDLSFLPENHTDFIFATLSETFGFVGSVTVLILYGVFLTRLYRLSISSATPQESQWLLSIMAMLGFQICVNIGMNIGLAPVTGITLPFLSYGGSSLVSLALILGLANSIRNSNSNLV